MVPLYWIMTINGRDEVRYVSEVLILDHPLAYIVTELFYFLSDLFEESVT